MTWSDPTAVAMFVGLGMAEIVSAVPTSGGPYFWAAILAPKSIAPFASWVTGWYDEQKTSRDHAADPVPGSTS